LANPDVYRLTYRDAYSGSGPYDRIVTSFSPPASDFVSSYWLEPIPFNLDHDFGLALAFSATAVWATTPARVYRARLDNPDLDITADVLEADIIDEPFNPRGGTIVLRNEDGRYNNPGSGSIAALTLGAQVDISPGYGTASGPLSSQGPSYYIEAFQHTVGPADARLIIHIVTAWAVLQRWTATRSYNWAAGQRSVRLIAQYIAARAGFALSCSNCSPASSTLQPPYTINPAPWIYRLWPWSPWYDWSQVRALIRRDDDWPMPALFTIRLGQTALRGLQNLLERVPDRPLIQAGDIILKDVPASETSVYSYGTTHAIPRGHYRTTLKPAAHIQVFAGATANILGESIDYNTLDLRYGSALHVSDNYLTTEGDADSRASKEDRHLTIDSRDDVIVVPVNCGQELWDVIEITEPRLGLSAAKRRVVALRLRLRRDPPTYDHILTLGEP